MDEITCPACGRPNLPEAFKCWYCQVSLGKDEIPSDGINQSDNEEKFENREDSNQSEETPNEEDTEIPEWLLKIRQRVREEMPPDDEVDSWEQEALFNNSSNENNQQQSLKSNAPKLTSKQTRKKTHLEKKPAQISMEEESKSLTEDEANKINNRLAEEQQDNSELPDGFVQLKRDDG